MTSSSPSSSPSSSSSSSSSSSLDSPWELVDTHPVSKKFGKTRWCNGITLWLNGELVELSNVNPNTSLLTWLRNDRQLPGTKFGCGEGGCGACTAILLDFSDEDADPIAINTCLRPLIACNGMAIITIEGISTCGEKPAAWQRALHDCYGTQCGFCTPGMVMSVSALKMVESEPTPEQVVHALDGNLCRCTGYRPIVEAFLSTQDKPELLEESKKDVEALKKAYGPSQEQRAIARAAVSTPIYSTLTQPSTGSSFPPFVRTKWMKPLTLDQAVEVYAKFASEGVAFIAGNTGSGVFPHQAAGSKDPPSVVIDVTGIPELLELNADNADNLLRVGGAVTLNKWLDYMKDNIGQSEGWMNDLEALATTQVRNAGTLAGNVALTARHAGDFASDVVVCLSGLGALVEIAVIDDDGAWTLDRMTLPDFLAAAACSGMARLLIVRFLLPSTPVNALHFKVASRARNAHAHVNLSMTVTASAEDGTWSDVHLACGGAYLPALQPCGYIIPNRTLEVLRGSTPNADTLKEALVALYDDLTVLEDPTSRPPWPTPLGNDYTTKDPLHSEKDYAVYGTMGLFYKAFLQHADISESPELESAAARWVRPPPKGDIQYSEPDPELSPISEAMPKLESMNQIQGGARYTADLPAAQNQLYGVLVLSDKALASIEHIDTSAAANAPGVVRVITALDIPGSNDFSDFPETPDEVFASTKVVCHGQPVALVVAKTQDQAAAAVPLVKVTYVDDLGPPIIFTEDAIAAKSFYTTDFTHHTIARGDVDAAIAEAQLVVEGTVYTPTQAHFYMENQTAVSYRDENNQLILTAATQDPSGLQRKVANVLGIPRAAVVSKTRRCGGGYGGKTRRSAPTATASAVAAWLTGARVLVTNDRKTDTRTTGKRHAFLAKYKAAINIVDGAPVITGLSVDMYANSGCSLDSSIGVCILANLTLDNCYDIPNWKSTSTPCATNIPSNTANRTFGAIQGAAIIEAIMADIAANTFTPVDELRQRHFYAPNGVTPWNQKLHEDDYTLTDVWNQVREDADWDNRSQAVADFNAGSRWVKRGLACVPLKYGMGLYYAGATVHVYGDGTVRASVSGTELGQGLYTRASQAIAYGLGIPMDLIYIGDTSTAQVPNTPNTGGSITTESNVYALVKATKQLNERLAPIRAQLPEDATWQEVVALAVSQTVNLTGQAFLQAINDHAEDDDEIDYFNYGAAVLEAEVDGLTGAVRLLHSSLVYDCGRSLNPAIDLGQCEGGFVQGLGFALTEHALVNADGELLSPGTWDYKIPMTADIPAQMNCKLLNSSDNKRGVLSSKASGEPPMVLAVVAIEAIRDAVSAFGEGARPSAIQAPATPQSVRAACGVDPADFYV